MKNASYQNGFAGSFTFESPVFQPSDIQIFRDSVSTLEDMCVNQVALNFLVMSFNKDDDFSSQFLENLKQKVHEELFNKTIEKIGNYNSYYKIQLSTNFS